MEEKINCRICGAKTFSLYTELCDNCWELVKRIEADPVIAEKILQELKDVGGAPDSA